MNQLPKNKKQINKQTDPNNSLVKKPVVKKLKTTPTDDNDVFTSVSSEEITITAGTIKVDRDTNLAKVIYKYPDVAEILTDYGLHCVGCFLNAFDTLEAGAKVHGLSDENIEEMIKRINEVIEFGE
jgi:hybrid cluster-associated redox disulfide protein